MHRRFENSHDEQGMTVVEVVAALAVVSLVLVSLWEGYNLAELSRRKALLQQNVAQTAETLLMQVDAAVDGDSDTIETTAGNLSYQWQITAAQTAGLQDVTLTITDEATAQQWHFMTVRRS